MRNSTKCWHNNAFCWVNYSHWIINCHLEHQHDSRLKYIHNVSQPLHTLVYTREWLVPYMVTIVVLAVNMHLYNCECTPVQLSLVERIHNVNGCINNGNDSKWLLYMNGKEFSGTNLRSENLCWCFALMMTSVVLVNSKKHFSKAYFILVIKTKTKIMTVSFC